MDDGAVYLDGEKYFVRKINKFFFMKILHMFGHLLLWVAVVVTTIDIHYCIV